MEWSFAMRTMSLSLLGSAFLLAAHVVPASAQATRTWVSGVGDDVNPCSRTAPCKTFPGAISKTAANGEINCLDPAGFGGVTITKSITIACEFTEGGILSAGTNGVNVNGAGIVVVLRGLDIEGSGSGLVGVNIIQAAAVHIEKSIIHGFRSGTATGIRVSTGATANVTVTDTSINDNTKGITLNSTGGFAVLTADNVRIFGNSSDGIELLSNNTFANVRNSVISHNTGNGVVATTVNGQINVSESALTNNVGTAVNALSGTSRIRISRNAIYNNGTGFNLGAGASIETDGTNRTGGNGGATIPNAAIQLR
jgi:hypothetical protein